MDRLRALEALAEEVLPASFPVVRFERDPRRAEPERWLVWLRGRPDLSARAADAQEGMLLLARRLEKLRVNPG